MVNVIQRCFDDNNDDNKRLWQRWWTKSSKIISSESRTSQEFKNQLEFMTQEESLESIIKIKDSRSQESRSRFKIQEWRKDSIKISIKKFFFKTLNSTWVFDKTFTKEFLLSGNRLPYWCNRLPVAKWVWKSFQTEFTTFQLFSKGCNRLQWFGNRLPVPLNVEIQI